MPLKKRYQYSYSEVSASSLFMLPGVYGFLAVNPICKKVKFGYIIYLEQDLVREGPQPLKFAGIGGLSEFLG